MPLLLRLLVALLIAAPACAQTPPTSLRVALVAAPPFIIEQNGALTGFSIDLWNAVAAQLNIKTEYQLEPDSAALLNAMHNKDADLTIAPIFITAAREAFYDFSYPTLQPGLRIMVRYTGQETSTPNPLRDMLRLMFSRTTLLWLGAALLLVLIPAHLVWLLERREKQDPITSPRYFPGIFQALFWAASTLTTQAENFPRQWLMRAFSLLWMFVGVVFVAFYTAQLTTTLTVEKIQGAIQGPDDLPGKNIATIAGSTAAEYLQDHNATTLEFTTSKQMFAALLNGKADAAVFTTPVLQYYETHEGKGLVRTVGPEFDTGSIGIMMQLNSPMRRQIDIALLTLHENGTYQNIYQKWFGGP